MTKKGMSTSLMPEKLSVKLRPNVTAGLAKLVDEVKEEKNVQLSPLAECVEAHVRAILESNEKE